MSKILALTILLLTAASVTADKPGTAGKEQMNILFIGNSFTAWNDLPDLVKAVFEEGRPGLTVNTRKVIYGGQNLFTHWTYFQSPTFLEMSTVTDETIKERLARIQALQGISELPPEYTGYPASLGKKSKMPPMANFMNMLGWAVKQHEQLLKRNPRTKWDYVVLQSWEDEHADLDQGYGKWAAKFAEIAAQHGTKVVLYITAPFIQNAKPVEGPQLQEAVDLRISVARQLANKINAYAVVPVPLAINMIQQGGTDLTFCFVNNFHPNQTTGFLTANMFYAAFFKESTEGFAFDTVVCNKLDDQGKDPDGGDAKVVFEGETKTYLQRMAFEAVKAFDQSLGTEKTGEAQE